MKYGCCVSMIAGTPGGSGAEWISAVKDAGYNYIELPIVQLSTASEDDFEKVLEDLHSAGLSCLTMNNLLPATNKITGPHANHDAIFRFLEGAVERIERIGAKKLVFGSAGAKNIPEGFSWDRAFDQTASFLTKLSDFLPEDIIVATEPICRKDANFINSLEEGAKLVQAVNRENIRLLADSYHMTQDHESFDEIVKYGKLLGHVHFATDDSRVMPVVLNDSMMRFLRAVHDASYDDTLTFEAVSDDPARDLKPAVDAVRGFVDAL